MTPAEKLAAMKAAAKTKRRHYRTPFVCHARRRREKLNLAIADVAKAIEITESKLGMIEHGSNVTLENAFKLCEFYGCDLTELWERKK